MTTLFEGNGLLKAVEGKLTTLLTGGGEWTPEEIKAMTPRQVTQAEYNFRAQQEVAKEEERVAQAIKNTTLKENYKNNVKTVRSYVPLTNA